VLPPRRDRALPKVCSAHGLRKAACRRLAVERYTRAADRARLAKRAMATVIKARPKVSKKDEV
jgi:hypothetical protein